MARITRVDRLLFEAYRRNAMADSHERSKSLRHRWLGLGTEAAYRPVLEAGLMVFEDGKVPPPRCMGWLCLTEDGIKAMIARLPRFRPVLAEMLQSEPYRRSFRANFMLAGGLSGR